MSDYPEGECKNQDIHQTHIHVDNGPLERCPGQGENEEYVYRLVYEETGIPVGSYMTQHVYKNIGSARGVCTKHNRKSWIKEKAVVVRGKVQWDSEPV